MCVFVWRKWGGNRRVSGVKRKQRAVFPLAATVLLPQHESPPMYYHVQEAGLSAQKMGGSSAAFNSFCIFFATVHPCYYKHCISYCGPPAWFAEEKKKRLHVLRQLQPKHYTPVFSWYKLKYFSFLNYLSFTATLCFCYGTTAVALCSLQNIISSVRFLAISAI